MILFALTDDPIRMVNLVVAIITLVFLFCQMRKGTRGAAWAVPVMLWMVHTIIYYIVIIATYGDMNGKLHDWSPVLRLHGYFTILGIELIRWYSHRPAKVKGE